MKERIMVGQGGRVCLDTPYTRYTPVGGRTRRKHMCEGEDQNEGDGQKGTRISHCCVGCLVLSVVVPLSREIQHYCRVRLFMVYLS